MLGALIGAGSSIVGGLLSKKSAENQQKRAAKDRKNEVINRPSWIREGAEKAGFNPLTYMGVNGASTPGASGGPGPGAALASSIARAGEYFGDAIYQQSVDAKMAQTQEAAKRQLERVRRDQRRVQPKLSPSTVRRSSDPSRTAEGIEPKMAPYDEDREMEKLTATDGPGVTTIDNDFLPGPIHVPGDGGEPWGWDEVLTATMFGVPQTIYQGGKKIGNWIDDKRMDRHFDNMIDNRERQKQERSGQTGPNKDNTPEHLRRLGMPKGDN